MFIKYHTLLIYEMNFIDIVDDILINEIFTRLTSKHILLLSLTCKYLNNFIYDKFNFFNPFSDRIKRLQEWESNKPNQKCSIILDRMHYVYATDNESTIVIFAKIHISDDYCTCGSPGIQYTNDGWKTVKYGHFQTYDDNLWYVVFYKHEIEWFALQVVAIKKNDMRNERYDLIKNRQIKSWDNNHGQNYCISRKYHWMPDYINRKLINFKYYCDHQLPFGKYQNNAYSVIKAGYLSYIDSEEIWMNNDVCV